MNPSRFEVTSGDLLSQAWDNVEDNILAFLPGYAISYILWERMKRIRFDCWWWIVIDIRKVVHLSPGDSSVEESKYLEFSWQLHCSKTSNLKELLDDLNIFKMNSTTRRYAHMNCGHIFGFPNWIPCIDWKTDLPKFIDGNEDDAILHLIKFHWHIHKLGIRFYEDCLMKMFMATLVGKIRSWYEGLKLGSLFSLKEFHTTFFEFYGKSHHSFLLFEDCCESCENYI